ncbi:hypothetical protein BT69DRAFT_523515 [Atractiella rhizophila]|nr:hypothetical protein BT69DRAFT_523515 [Atractiella rhizophila]
MPPATPTPPSETEARFFYYGLPSCPKLVARSSTYVWIEKRGLWESTLADQMEDYILQQGVQLTSIDPYRIGYVGATDPPPVIWVGVVPNSLSGSVGCRHRRCLSFAPPRLRARHPRRDP